MKATVYDLIVAFSTDHADTARAKKVCAAWCGMFALGNAFEAPFEDGVIFAQQYRFDSLRTCDLSEERIRKALADSDIKLIFESSTSVVWKATKQFSN